MKKNNFTLHLLAFCILVAFTCFWTNAVIYKPLRQTRKELANDPQYVELREWVEESGLEPRNVRAVLDEDDGPLALHVAVMATFCFIFVVPYFVILKLLQRLFPGRDPISLPKPANSLPTG